MTGTTIPNAPGGALAAADITAATLFAVSKAGVSYKFSLPSNVVAMIVNNALQSAGLAANAVTRAKLEKMAANGFIGNDDGATQDPQHLTVAEAQALLLGALTEADPVAGDFLVGIDTSASNALKKYDFKWMNRAPDIILQDQQSSGTNGGSSSAGTNTRVINTEVRDINGDCSLASNAFTLTAGTYYAEWCAPAYRSNYTKASIYNNTAPATVLPGDNGGYASNSGNAGGLATGSGVFTIAASQSLILQHYCQTAYATIGLGVGAATGNTQIYAHIRLWRIA